MKCPKCNYLGFETGDRCKNCGYDFSLVGSSSAADLSLRPAGDEDVVSARWVGDINLREPSVEPPHGSQPEPEPAQRGMGPRAAAAPVAASDQRLPLFTRPRGDDSDEPLIKMPPAPRPPLAVRRTPAVPKLRAVTAAPAPAKRDDEPLLEFASEPVPGEVPAYAGVRSAARVDAGPVTRADAGAAARVSAAALDHVVLLAIDVVVVYFTLRISGLTMSDWRALPPLPMAAFLFLVKSAYFCAFTIVGGQTLGKMTARLQVVTDTGGSVDGGRAIKRTIAGLASTAVLGLGYVPALLGPDRRALHDRVAGTRVVALPAA